MIGSMVTTIAAILMPMEKVFKRLSASAEAMLRSVADCYVLMMFCKINCRGYISMRLIYNMEFHHSFHLSTA